MNTKRFVLGPACMEKYEPSAPSLTVIRTAEVAADPLLTRTPLDCCRG